MQWNHFQDWQLGLSYEKALQTFDTFCENLSGIAIAALQRNIYFIRLRPEDFSTQTDWFYSYQCNETIFKADN